MAHDEELLVRELAKTGNLVGKFSSVLGDAPEQATGLAASMGARVAATFMPTERVELTIVIPVNAGQLMSEIRAYLLNHGRIEAQHDAQICGVVKSGFLKMNPALLYAKIVELTESQSQLQLVTAAKEGLVKQQTAQKAADDLLQTIRVDGRAAA